MYPLKFTPLRTPNSRTVYLCKACYEENNIIAPLYWDYVVEATVCPTCKTIKNIEESIDTEIFTVNFYKKIKHMMDCGKFSSFFSKYEFIHKIPQYICWIE